MIVNKHNRVAGVMSGTSLDGLDICLACFGEEKEGTFTYTIYAAETVSYPQEWHDKLLEAEQAEGSRLAQLHMEFGVFIGQRVKKFLSRIPAARKPAYVASHGHTVFHRPDREYTFQLGSGAAIAAAGELPVVADFRTTDVALGGQGAPLVPIGDKFLFGEFDYCLNLGGFANISFDEEEKRIAYDICPVNYVMNRLAEREGRSFDENGKLAASGKLIRPLLAELNKIPYYRMEGPKSVGREWAEHDIFPLLHPDVRTADLLHTFVEHVAQQIARNVGHKGKMLITGGGAHNAYLIKQLKRACTLEIVVPDQMTIDFKEALIFGFLGWLRWRNKINVLASVTGATRDSCSGAIYL